MTPKVDGILRQRYAECKVASNVFRRPLSKITLYEYVMSTTFGAGIFRGAEGH
jgi:hypothetical protein